MGLEDNIVENICGEINGTVVAANYNCPGQLVISGELNSIEIACEKLKEIGAEAHVIDSLQVNHLGYYTSKYIENKNSERYIGFLNERLSLIRNNKISSVLPILNS